jgi:GT2 family glycosyltransferase
MASVVIPNWNGLGLLQQCLSALEKQSTADFEVIVVDNGSSDDSVDWLKREAAWVRLIALEENLGFSAAVNQGIQASRAPYIVLLNNDTLARPDWLAQLVKAMNENPEASFGASLMLLFEPPHLIDSAGDGFSFYAGDGFNIGAGESAGEHSEPAWVFGACAGAAIYRRSLFQDIGLFDEDFFLVFEDVDISLRAQVAGHRCLYIPEAVVYHHRGASTASASKQVRLRAWRNHLWVAGKNLPPLLMLLWSISFVQRLFRLAVYTILAKRKGVPDVIDFAHYLATLRQALLELPAKRRATAACRRTGSWALLRRIRRQPIRTESREAMQ